MNFGVSNYYNQNLNTNLDTMKKNIQTAFVIILFFGISNCTNAQNSSKMTKEKEMTTVELTSFNLTEVVEEAKFIEAAKQTEQSFLNDQKGYLKRTLLKEKMVGQILYFGKILNHFTMA